MAQLNYQQKAELKSDARFQNRFHMAQNALADYHINNQPSQLAHFNEERKKLTAYARKIKAQGGTVSAAHIADFISLYDTDIQGSVLEDSNNPFDAATNQLNDTQLKDSSIAAIVFARQAGVEAGDSTKQIVL